MKNIFLTAKSASLNQRRVLAFLLMVTITLALTPRPAGATDQVPFKASFATEFKESLAALRQAEERSQAWRARRDLDVYLTLLEQDKGPG